jgi:hypothetical protein
VCGCEAVWQEKACEFIHMWTQSLLFVSATRQLDFSFSRDVFARVYRVRDAHPKKQNLARHGAPTHMVSDNGVCVTVFIKVSLTHMWLQIGRR